MIAWTFSSSVDYHSSTHFSIGETRSSDCPPFCYSTQFDRYDKRHSGIFMEEVRKYLPYHRVFAVKRRRFGKSPRNPQNSVARILDHKHFVCPVSPGLHQRGPGLPGLRTVNSSPSFRVFVFDLLAQVWRHVRRASAAQASMCCVLPDPPDL
jgi:hypothetical protein